MLPSNCLSGWRESQVNIFYHTSGHKESQCPCFETIRSLSPHKKPSAKRGELVVMDEKKVGTYGGWKAYTKQLVQNPWELKAEYHIKPIGNGPTCTSNFCSNTATSGFLEILITRKAKKPSLLLSSSVSPNQQSNTLMFSSKTSVKGW